jgi:hypothetical protein
MSRNGSKSRTLHTSHDGKNRVPWCTAFGTIKDERKAKFPNAKFCSNCEAWESRDPLNKRAKQTSVRFACQANFGLNWFVPTSQKDDWWANTTRTKVGPNSKKRENEGEPIVGPPVQQDDSPHPKKTRTRNKSCRKKEKLSITLTRLQCQLSVQASQLKAANASIDSLKADKNRLNSKVSYWERKKGKGKK